MTAPSLRPPRPGLSSFFLPSQLLKVGLVLWRPGVGEAAAMRRHLLRGHPRQVYACRLPPLVLSSYVSLSFLSHPRRASLALVPVQKPLSQGKTLRKPLVSHSLPFVLTTDFLVITNWTVSLRELLDRDSMVLRYHLLWTLEVSRFFSDFFRGVLVFELSPSVLLVAISTLVRGPGSAAKSRGIFFLVLGFLSLLLMDKDSTIDESHSELPSFPFLSK